MKPVLMCAVAVLLTTSLSGQTSTSGAAPDAPKVMVITGGGFGPGEPDATGFFYREVMRGGEFVKGAPYTATATTETTQVLADGNRIVHKSTTLLARDSEGRTRREETASNFGPLAVNAPREVMITDPEAGTQYILNLDEQVGHAFKEQGSKIVTVEQKQRLIKREGETKALAREFADVKRESLGTQVIEGVTCEGQLETQVIAPGTIGNERPITVTSETWASPELHLLVARKHNDPRFGETVYKLTDIRRVEPDPALFLVPSNVRIIDKLPPVKAPLD